MTKLSRREILKLAGVFSASAALSSLGTRLQNVGKTNILILLFDTMSARHLSLYGYPRETTPHLEKFAQRATVYHSHYSGGNFTTPATASLFMGMFPWKHRAQTQGGLVRRDYVDQNLFALLGDDYYKVSFAQTGWANVLMKQFAHNVEKNLPPSAFSLTGSRSFIDRFLREKTLLPFLFDDFTTHLIPDLPGNLVTGYLNTVYNLYRGSEYTDKFPEYPKGLPSIEGVNILFRLEDVFAGVFEEIKASASQPLPYFNYYHLFSPHDPYRPRVEFMDLFKDKYKPVQKPLHPLSEDLTTRSLLMQRQKYNRYIANVDREFGNLIKRLEQDGLLENTILIVTSDHGELFERGTDGHGGPLMFEDVIHIPLLIRVPGQTDRVDIHTRTSNVDLLPTLLTLAGKDVPQNVDGTLLPGFGGVEDTSRSIFSMVSARSSAFGHLHIGTFAMQNGPYKLVYYHGYEEYMDKFELYNTQEDPEELIDLFPKAPSVARTMKDELLESLAEHDLPR